MYKQACLYRNDYIYVHLMRRHTKNSLQHIFTFFRVGKVLRYKQEMLLWTTGGKLEVSLIANVVRTLPSLKDIEIHK